MDILEVFMTKCTCMTKTPELAFHKDDCKFKVAWVNYFNECRPPSTDKGQNDESKTKE